jgi:two-component system chemotaxis response regulator CheB
MSVSETAYIPSAKDPIRVLLVDDSSVTRAFLRQFIEEDAALKVISTAKDGQGALDCLKNTQVDVVVLDIEMPVMDGLTALPLILKIDPSLQVIIASTLTKENAVLTMKCFQGGAAECLAKPNAQELSAGDGFKQSLIEKVKALGIVTRKKRASRAQTAPTTANRPQITISTPKKFTLRPELVKLMPDVIVIGSSTGGPQALMQFFTELKTPLRQPVFVTQHMPPTFTTILAEHISKQSGLKCREAIDGEIVQGGNIYLAPGNYHMTIKMDGMHKTISLNQEPPENFCRPAVDPMLRSLVAAYGRKILTVIFTGMGSDGMKGCQKVVEAGGTVLAQDEASSVVWGMPGAVAMAGLCTQVLPLGVMAKTVREYADRMAGG